MTVDPRRNDSPQRRHIDAYLTDAVGYHMTTGLQRHRLPIINHNLPQQPPNGLTSRRWSPRSTSCWTARSGE